MKKISVEDIIKAVNGKININIDTNICIQNVCTDTRKIQKGDLFIAIEGENFDGHDFINTAFEKGASVCICHKKINSNKPIIYTEDSKKALGDLASYYLSLFNLKVVALTGSTGKTTTKDMIASCLSLKYNTVKTEGNFNNDIGMPLTIFNVEDDTQVLVLEMGMNNFGEIRYLSKIAKPDIALITNIGVSHIENLGSREGIFRAKYEIFDYLKDTGVKILNADDDMLKSVKSEDISKKVYFYSLNNSVDAYATNIVEKGLDGTFAKINYNGEKSFDLNLKMPGVHILSNALATTLICDELNLSSDEIKKGLENFKASKMRLDIIKTKNYTIINDTYNANPNSMKASINILKNANGRKVAILGDMLELGIYENEMHFEIGKYAIENDVDELICIGEKSYFMIEGAKSVNKNSILHYFETQDEFLKNIKSILKNKDNILIKASRGMKLENTVDEIMRW